MRSICYVSGRMSSGARCADRIAMLRRSCRLAFLGWLVAGTVALEACVPPTAALPRQPAVPYFCTIRLAAGDEEILIADVSAGDTTWRAMAPVSELGGRVTATIGDTLVVQPYYITRRAAPPGAPPATIYRGGPAAMPDLVRIPMTSNVSLSAFRTPGIKRRPLPVIPLVLGGLLIFSVLAADVSLLFSL